MNGVNRCSAILRKMWRKPSENQFSQTRRTLESGADMSSSNQGGTQCGRTRRQFLWEAGAGFTGVAMAGMLDGAFFAKQAVAADGKTPFVNPLAPRKPQLPAKAKSVIFLYMYGGPSQIDTFDYKPG